MLKALHLIFVVSWFAGLFYIFRLFVYHIENWEFAEIRKVFEVMERRLLSYIMLPAAILVVFFGLLMIIENSTLLLQSWMQVKLTAVSVLFIYHGYAYYVYRQLANGRRVLSSRQCRIINEIPTLILILIMILVFLRPALCQKV